VCCSCKQCVAACRALLRRRRASVRWLRLVDSLKTKVSSAKEPYKRDDIMKKRRYYEKETYIFKESTNHSHPARTGTIASSILCVAHMCIHVYIYMSAYVYLDVQILCVCINVNISMYAFVYA